jgi:hypothetical protein
MDMIADNIIQKYQPSCQQLWQREGQAENAETEGSRKAPARRSADARCVHQQVAAPIANKMSECGMLP